MDDQRSKLEAMIDACVEAWRTATDGLAVATALFVLRDLEARLAKLEIEDAGTEPEPSTQYDEPLPE